MSYNYEARLALDVLGIDAKGHLPVEGATLKTFPTIVRYHGNQIPVVLDIFVKAKSEVRSTGRPHRLMAVCSYCGKVTSFGRVFQHLTVHFKD